jgi:hypothetical protein
MCRKLEFYIKVYSWEIENWSTQNLLLVIKKKCGHILISGDFLFVWFWLAHSASPRGEAIVQASPWA